MRSPKAVAAPPSYPERRERGVLESAFMTQTQAMRIGSGRGGGRKSPYKLGGEATKNSEEDLATQNTCCKVQTTDQKDRDIHDTDGEASTRRR